MVPGAGLEPAQPFSREILSLLCLPISPSGHCFVYVLIIQVNVLKVNRYFVKIGASGGIRTPITWFRRPGTAPSAEACLEEGGGIEPQPLCNRSVFETALGPA